MKYKSLLLIAIAIISCAFMPLPGDNPPKLNKTMDDDNSKYTNVGNIGLTVSNFAVYGNGLKLLTQPGHPPSCEYPLGSGIEHIFAGGLWVGGFKKDAVNSNTKTGPFVTTGAVDVSSLNRGGGFEFTSDKGTKIVERSSLLDSRFYSPLSISHQDFLMDYSDTNTSLEDGTIIVDHTPLGLAIHEEDYAWNYPFADFFVIKNYTIKNVSNKVLDSVYVGMYQDAVVRNTKITTTTNSAFFSHGGNGYDDSLKIDYAYDVDGDVGFTNSYVGFLYLGADPVIPDHFIEEGSLGVDTIPSTSAVIWQWNTGSITNFFAPQNDNDRYSKMQGWFQYPNRWGKGIDPNYFLAASNRSNMISHGYFKDIKPGDSINVAFAIVCADKYGNDPASLNTREQRNILYSNADWALRAYFGNDRNRNGVIDSTEDIFGDGKIHRYILPAPPTVPIMKVVPEQNKVTIYWDKRAESSVDPISGKHDFAGYRIYRTQSGFDLSTTQNIIGSLVRLAQYDSAGSTGFNTGFKSVELAQPVTFPNDPTEYYYKYEVPNLLDGWQYLFSVTAFDKGDPSNNLDPLESSFLANLKRILPGTESSEDPNVKIGVYPNPYYGNAIWDGSSERLRKINFYNLPADCEITIYTLAGDVVKRIQHNQNSNGQDIRWFDQYANDKKEQFTGGEHAWDLITDNDQAIATGLYLYTVKNNKSGSIKTGKFLVIK